jgi:hypothetical protein
MSEPAPERRPALPEIRRARDYHLYGAHGRRYLDLYQNGGRAILSHRPKGLAKRLKGVVDQGLWGDYPSVHIRRLETVLRTLFPAYPEVRLYATAERAVAAAGGAVADPALAARGGSEGDGRGGGEAEAPRGAPHGPGAAWWRPFLPADTGAGDGGVGSSHHEAAAPDLLLPVLPFPASFAPQPVCAVRSGLLPDSDAVSPVLLAGLVQAAHLIAAVPSVEDAAVAVPGAPGAPGAGGAGGAEGAGGAGGYGAAGPVPDAAVYPITLFDERGLTLWSRRGPYLQLRCGEESFSGVFSVLLDAGIIINPVFPGPSILPQWCSRGEFEKFVKASRMADS